MNRILSSCLPSTLLAVTALACAGPTHAANGLTVLHTFDGVDGGFVSARLVEGPDGTFYGTAGSGGSHGVGTVYRVNAAGDFSILHSFDSMQGESTGSGLVLMDDGFLYGSTPRSQSCNSSQCRFTGGTVFRMATDGTAFSTLHLFVPTVAGNTPGPVMDGGDGLLYGLTEAGGSALGGTAFAVAPDDGTLVVLANFDRTTGYRPYGGLTLGPDGNFYGLASSGGANEQGTVFRMTPNGAISTIYHFTDATGIAEVKGNLLLGSDGRLYGGTIGAGPQNAGIIFAITTAGDLTVLHTFNGSDGAGLEDQLAEGDDGFLYGASNGTLFRLAKDGQRFMTLHLFTIEEGISPFSSPIFGSDGRLYGTTFNGGSPTVGAGTVYAFDPAAPRTPDVRLIKNCTSQDGSCADARVGQAVRLKWYSLGVDACQASGAWTGSRPSSGIYKFLATRPGTFLYRLDCTGPDGPASTKVVLTVN